MATITEVEITEFSFTARNLGVSSDKLRAIYNMGYKPNSSLELTKFAIVIRSDDGAQGEYVMHWGGSRSTMAQTLSLAPSLLGRDPDHRELIWNEMKRELRQHDGMGIGPIDIALWDLAGKRYGASVSALLGGYRTRLKSYASTYHGDRNGGLDSPQAFADFAERCYELGYRAYKVHGWHEGDAKEEARNVLHVAKAVGDRMTLMLDPANELRTFADALYVGRACDEANYFWYEDPMRDCGVSAFAHKKLREMLKTPILQTEYLRGFETKADFLIAGGTDMLRSDPEYDLGITGAMKIAHLAEAFGVDVEIHACGPAHRHCMAATRNTNFYEIALLGPDCPNAVPPVYTCGYSDQIDAVDKDGTVPVPTGPGLGVSYDWDYIRAHKTAQQVFRL
ncbi:enolase C-terminal domain-like protein [Bosea sp. (in: a-proteobacteria)]|jgi:L-alanine-DL-glutamate epimerase-like enolase superfamily enzyme|uniref:enolase C-terminal domain-like protein n=1 Tax=Bosea sp. (in: a-proteobacteria) TaxID=1871050 RepID=UPI001AC1C1EF|nr:enolase C-terminal domain-like protein [Bosea sp. (in: a-proteobacteria)]MBN9440091.1 mandelate racemase [Bosea sp. (in: a-proteobacteria)]MBN9468432.1 mandelate racemase [Bosea sp. (in: a-proteobacteria)]